VSRHAHIALAALALAAAAAPAAQAREKPAGPPAAAGKWIVVYERSAGPVDAETAQRERARGFRAGLRFHRAVRGFAARLTAAQVRALRADPEVASVVPDRPRRATGAALAAGQAVPTGVRRVGAGTLATVRGSSTSSVAIVDTGVDLTHPDLNVGPGTDCTGIGSADDDNGHGSHVAGTIGARNSAGSAVGVAPGTRVLPVKVLDSEGSGSDSTVICGLDWVTAHAASDHIGVANLSLGGLGTFSSCGDGTDPLHQAVCRTVGAGVTVVVAAGNDAWDFGAAPPDTPAWYPEVLTVTAMSDGDGLAGGAHAPGCTSSQGDDVPAGFSNFATLGDDTAHTIAAPGVCIASTYKDGGYAMLSGTSMATPHIAGLVALCQGESGTPGPCAGMTPAQVIDRLRADAAQATALGNGFTGDPTLPSQDRWYGHLAHAVAEGGQSPASQLPPTPTPAPSTDPAPADPPPATTAQVPTSTPAAHVRTCTVRTRLYRHVHRRVHWHSRGAGLRPRAHVHRSVHVHHIRYKLCA
jgi:subtilisin family serine protease